MSLNDTRPAICYIEDNPADLKLRTDIGYIAHLVSYDVSLLLPLDHNNTMLSVLR